MVFVESMVNQVVRDGESNSRRGDVKEKTDIDII
jgi:hypothetical protein